METLDWGQVTPESANIEKNEFTYVYNQDLSSPEKIDRTIRFIVGRLNYYNTQLPKDSKHTVKIDVRGQQVTDSACAQIKNEILSMYSRPHSLSIDIVK